MTVVLAGFLLQGSPKQGPEKVLTGRYKWTGETSFAGMTEWRISNYRHRVVVSQAKFQALLATSSPAASSEYWWFEVRWMLVSTEPRKTYFVDINGVVRDDEGYRKVDVRELENITTAAPQGAAEPASEP